MPQGQVVRTWACFDALSRARRTPKDEWSPGDGGRKRRGLGSAVALPCVFVAQAGLAASNAFLGALPKGRHAHRVAARRGGRIWPRSGGCPRTRTDAHTSAASGQGKSPPEGRGGDAG